jgi:hypothetical protein
VPFKAKLDYINGWDTPHVTNHKYKICLRNGLDFMTTKAPADYETGDNIVYNDTATRQFHFLVNGKNSSKNDVTITGYRCV